MAESGDGVVVENLTVVYGDVVAVDGASFSAPAGAVTVVLGPNGAGKTSTIEVCEGFRVRSSGTVSVLGLDPATRHRELTRRMGVMLQDGGVYPSARVAETVSHYCTLHGRGADPTAIIEMVGLTHRARGAWRRLSGGERQRMSLALALAARPDVAFLDEPTSGVDIDGRVAVRRIVRSLADGGATVVLATHELDEAEQMADNVVVFAAGRVVATGPLESLRAGHQRVSFRTRAGLDADGLGRAIGATVRAREATVGADGTCWYDVPSADEARLVAAVGGWLAEHGLPLIEMRAGQESLAELYRRVTAGGGA